MKKKLTSSQEFVQRLELLDVGDAEPLANNAEAKKIMREAGVDPKAFLERTLKHIQGVRSKLSEGRLAQAAQARNSESVRFAGRARSFASLSIEELKARVRALGASPQGLAVTHKGLTGPASREELEALLAEHEHLENEK